MASPPPSSELPAAAIAAGAEEPAVRPSSPVSDEPPVATVADIIDLPRPTPITLTAADIPEPPPEPQPKKRPGRPKKQAPAKEKERAEPVPESSSPTFAWGDPAPAPTEIEAMAARDEAQRDWWARRDADDKAEREAVEATERFLAAQPPDDDVEDEDDEPVQCDPEPEHYADSFTFAVGFSAGSMALWLLQRVLKSVV